MAEQMISPKAGTYIRRNGTTALAIMALLVPGTAGIAQEGDGGFSVNLTVGQRLESVEETGRTTPEDEGVRSLTTFDLGIRSQTRKQSLTFGLNGNITRNFSRSESFEIDEPSAQLNYAISSRNSAFTVGANYRRVDVDDTAFEESLLPDGTIVVDDTDTGDGKRETFNLNTGLTFGTNSRVTTRINHTYGRTEFSGTTGTNDTTVQELSARSTLILSDETNINVSASRRVTDEEGVDANDRVVQQASIGVDHAFDQVLRLSASLSYSINDTTNNGRTEGLGYNLGLSRALDNGAVSVNLSESVTVNGTRRQLTLGRTMETRLGDLSFSVGATKTDGFSARPLLNLSLDYELDPTSSLRVSLSQSASVSSSDAEIIRTSLNANYSRDLTERASLSAGLQLVEQNALGDGATDQQSLQLNLSHNYALGADWGLVSGYQYRNIRREGQVDRKTNTIFLGLEKSFAFRP